MYRLFHFICTVACVAASMQIYPMCPGTSFYIPPSPEYDPKTSDLYFTPQSGPSARVMVLNKTQSTDDHYIFKDETLFISELRETDTGIFSSRDGSKRYNTILKLMIKDCAEPKVVVFGNKFELDVPHNAAVLKFLSSSGGDPSTKGFDVYKPYVQEVVTYADAGFYTFRKKNLAELSKTQLIVTADVRFHNLEDDVLQINVPLPKYEVSMDFTTLEGEREKVIDNGELISDSFWLEMKSRPEGLDIIVHDVHNYRAGKFQVFDQEGNLVAVRFLSIQDSANSYYMYLYALIPIVLLILLCVCVKKCCCKKTKSSNASDPAAAEPMPYNAVEMNEPVPTNRTVTPHPVDTVPAEAAPSAPSAPSAFGFSSDHQPQYQLKGFDSSAGGFLTTSPLNTDNGAADGDPSVYSSSKLNW
ncbi:uncharacterized protein LOC134095253 [Sardina pilchardus]|uniref:uncharacterized protein LOC134095253 n=1 Tax=Sardina pilchardus TaxID=27697 RepID=UPI002E1635BA